MSDERVESYPYEAPRIEDRVSLAAPLIGGSIPGKLSE